MEIKVTLKFDREAKNTVRYMEATNPPKLYQGFIYIQKSALGSSPYPLELELTIATPRAVLAAVR